MATWAECLTWLPHHRLDSAWPLQLGLSNKDIDDRVAAELAKTLVGSRTLKEVCCCAHRRSLLMAQSNASKTAALLAAPSQLQLYWRWGRDAAGEGAGAQPQVEICLLRVQLSPLPLYWQPWLFCGYFWTCVV